MDDQPRPSSPERSVLIERNRRDGVPGGPRRRPRERSVQTWSEGNLLLLQVARAPWIHLLVYHRFTRFALAGKTYDQWLYAALDKELEGGIVAKYLDQVKAAQAAQKGEATARDMEFARTYPALWEFVSVTKNTDGTARQTATLLAFLEAGTWKVCLGDRDSGLSLWAAGETFLEALEALEACLQSPNPQWRQGSKRTPKRP